MYSFKIVLRGKKKKKDIKKRRNGIRWKWTIGKEGYIMKDGGGMGFTKNQEPSIKVYTTFQDSTLLPYVSYTYTSRSKNYAVDSFMQQ